MPDTKILIVDDHPFFRKGLLAMLSTIDDYRVVGEAGNGEEAIEKVAELQPDVVIMDITMPGLDGVTAARLIKDETPGTNIVMLSMHEDPIYALNSFRSGASAYIIKGSASGELLGALERVMAGKYYVSPIMANELLNDFLDVIKKKRTSGPDRYPYHEGEGDTKAYRWRPGEQQDRRGTLHLALHGKDAQGEHYEEAGRP